VHCVEPQPSMAASLVAQLLHAVPMPFVWRQVCVEIERGMCWRQCAVVAARTWQTTAQSDSASVRSSACAYFWEKATLEVRVPVFASKRHVFRSKLGCGLYKPSLTQSQSLQQQHLQAHKHTAPPEAACTQTSDQQLLSTYEITPPAIPISYLRAARTR
jgi:hypothetical protein